MSKTLNPVVHMARCIYTVSDEESIWLTNDNLPAFEYKGEWFIARVPVVIEALKKCGVKADLFDKEES